MKQRPLIAVEERVEGLSIAALACTDQIFLTHWRAWRRIGCHGCPFSLLEGRGPPVKRNDEAQSSYEGPRGVCSVLYTYYHAVDSIFRISKTKHLLVHGPGAFQSGHRFVLLVRSSGEWGKTTG